MKSILGLGVSGFIMAFTNSLVQIVCNSTLQNFGGDIYVAVMTVLSSVRDICTMPVMGLTNGASPVMSFNYGQKAYDRVKKAIRFVTVICVTYTFAAWGLLKLIPEVFIRIFKHALDRYQEVFPLFIFTFSDSALWHFSLRGKVCLWRLESRSRQPFSPFFEKPLL